METWIEVKGRRVKVHAQMIQQTLWVHFEGRTFAVETGSKRKSKGRGGSSASNDTIKAPMPGKITRIFVKDGDSVEKGQALLVMEAMKMEYTLKAEIAGIVKLNGLQVGEQVPLGKTLVRLEPGK